jgi:hypothetical protein
MPQIPTLTREQLRQQSSISQADIAEAQALLTGLEARKKPVKYLDGDSVKRVSGKVLRLLWEAKDG